MTSVQWLVLKVEIGGPKYLLTDREPSVSPASVLPSTRPRLLRKVNVIAPAAIFTTRSDSLTADGRLDLKQGNNEQNITRLVIRENISGEDINSKVHSVLQLPTTCSDKFGQRYVKLSSAHCMLGLYCPVKRPHLGVRTDRGKKTGESLSSLFVLTRVLLSEKIAENVTNAFPS